MTYLPIRTFLCWLTLALCLGCTTGQPGEGAGAAIVGQPIGGDVNAVPYARVSLNASDLFAVSDKAGRYTIPGILPGTYTIRVAKWNTPLVTLPITVKPDEQPDIDLGRIGAANLPDVTVSWPLLGSGPYALEGRVKDVEGRGLNECEILLIYADGALARAVTAPAGSPEEDGFFRLTGLPANPVRLIVGQEGFRPFVVESPFDELPQIGDDFTVGDVELRSLLPTGATAGTVTVEVRSTDGRLLAGVPVHLAVSDPERPLIDRFGIGGVTGSDGRWTFPAVPAGVSYSVWAGAGSWFPEMSSVTATSGEELVVSLRLTAAGSASHPYLHR
ncbi:MAG: hypothetical protein GEEBNDBF_00319 [bacterium]|nr:hypothetical protein [bacterium]